MSIIYLILLQTEMQLQQFKIYCIFIRFGIVKICSYDIKKFIKNKNC